MRHRVENCVPVSRAGISALEVIVVIIVLILIVAILLPGLQKPYVTNARIRCLNNLKMLSLSVISRATSQNGNLPMLSGPAPGFAKQTKVIWIVELLPYLDRPDLIECITAAKSEQQAREALNSALSLNYRVLQCPADAHHFDQPGGLSYGANLGYGAWRGSAAGIVTAYDFGATDHCASSIDWNQNGQLDATDKDVARATGAFWSEDEDHYRMKIDDFSRGDGSFSTIYFAETSNLPPMHTAGPAKNGNNPFALEMGFGLGYSSLGLSRKAAPSLFLDRNAEAKAEYTEYFKPSERRAAEPGMWPGTATLHEGRVNVVFADGHASSISKEINWAVWASQLTPNGLKYGQADIPEAGFEF